jgi:acylglycerol lipase
MFGDSRSIEVDKGIFLNCEVYENGRKEWIIVTHGIGEHLGRHQYLVNLLNEKYNICFYDLRGHGKSDGKAGNIESFDLFISDLGQVMDFITHEYRAEKISLFGHSMGGLITAAFTQQKEKIYYPEKVFINAPPIKVPGPLGKIVDCIPINSIKKLDKFKSGIYLKGLVDLGYLSHDKSVAENYVSDPLNRLSLNTKLLIGMIRCSRETFSRPISSQTKMYCCVGSDDAVVDPQAVVNYFSSMEKNVRLKVIEGAYHEIHNEVDKYQKPYFDFIQESLN